MGEYSPEAFLFMIATSTYKLKFPTLGTDKKKKDAFMKIYKKFVDPAPALSQFYARIALSDLKWKGSMPMDVNIGGSVKSTLAAIADGTNPPTDTCFDKAFEEVFQDWYDACSPSRLKFNPRLTLQQAIDLRTLASRTRKRGVGILPTTTSTTSTTSESSDTTTSTTSGSPDSTTDATF
eukprot:TRINITY_DN58051_c0_g1_i2.p1 TRINITY_DN58051_c0_g1~~TRINITY_DN58051_c0_g1_i2.p1  ORF type:complete len:179 (+),score=27.96 TRINITY_DN58051_c0_g1_i2:2-538(+)